MVSFFFRVTISVKFRNPIDETYSDSDDAFANAVMWIYVFCTNDRWVDSCDPGGRALTVYHRTLSYSALYQCLE